MWRWRPTPGLCWNRWYVTWPNWRPRSATKPRRSGRQAAELDAARAENRALLASTAPEPVDPTPEPSPARWRALAPWLLAVVLVAALATLVVLQAWPR